MFVEAVQETDANPVIFPPIIIYELPAFIDRVLELDPVIVPPNVMLLLFAENNTDSD